MAEDCVSSARQARQAGLSGEVDLVALSRACSTYRVNHRPDEYAAALDVSAFVRLDLGRLDEALLFARRGLHLAEARPAARLMAARAGLLATTAGRPGAGVERFRAEIRALLKLDVDRATLFTLTAYLMQRRFFALLAQFGRPTAYYPAPRTDAHMADPACRRLLEQWDARLRELSDGIALDVMVDPFPLLLLGQIQVCLHGWSGATATFQRAARVGQGGASEVLFHKTLACYFSRREGAEERMRQRLTETTATHQPFRRAQLLFAVAILAGERRDGMAAFGLLLEFHALWATFGAGTTQAGAVDSTTAFEGDAAEAPTDERSLIASEPPYLRRALKILEQSYATNVRFDELARTAGCSRRSLEVAFRQYRGTTPARALKEIRLRAARRMLGENPPSVAEVAVAVGYAGASGFIRDFRAYFGLTPGQVARMADPSAVLPDGAEPR